LDKGGGTRDKILLVELKGEASVWIEGIELKNRARFLFEDYLKGAAYSSGITNSLTLGAPVTLNLLYEGYNIINQHQALLKTYTDA